MTDEGKVVCNTGLAGGQWGASKEETCGQDMHAALHWK
jgi:hypothetical protein